MRRGLVAAIAAIIPHASSWGADLNSPPNLSVSAILGFTTDYTYRGVSLNGEEPSPALIVDASYGIAYFSGMLVGNELGTDLLGRSIGELEADATLGIRPSFGAFDFDVGVKYTGYPTGRDIIVNTLIPAERDFVEFFAGGKYNLTDAVSIGGMAYYTPDFYYETGEVRTYELLGTLVLPVFWNVNSRLTAVLGDARSETANIIAPGHGYVYFSAGIEGQFEKFVFDIRYWNTDVDGFDIFDERVVLSLGVKLP